MERLSQQRNTHNHSSPIAWALRCIIVPMMTQRLTLRDHGWRSLAFRSIWSASALILTCDDHLWSLAKFYNQNMTKFFSWDGRRSSTRLHDHTTTLKKKAVLYSPPTRPQLQILDFQRNVPSYEGSSAKSLHFLPVRFKLIKGFPLSDTTI